MKSFLGGNMIHANAQAARLILLTLLLATPSSAFPQQLPSTAQKWRQSQKLEVSGSPPYTQFTLPGKFVKWPEKDASNRPTLQLDCRSDETSPGPRDRLLRAYLLSGTPLSVQYVEPDAITTGISYFQKISVRYRLDNGKEKKEQWSPGADKNSVSIPKDVLKKMLEAHSVVVILNEDQAAEVSTQFEMPDSSELAQACGIGYHRK
jgi:hypothetical protein